MTSLTRRSLVKGSTWAIPAVLTTAAVPAYAASTKKDLCPAFKAEPTETFGHFKLTIDADTERLAVTAQDGTKLAPETFTQPQWILASDQTVAFWVPGTISTGDPTITLSLAAIKNTIDAISLIIDLPGCEPLFYNGTEIAKLQ